MRKLSALLILAVSLSAAAERDRESRKPTRPAAPAATVTVAPSSVAFGSVLETNLSAKEVTLTNSGKTAVTVTAIAATGSAQFVTSETWPVNALPFTVAAGKSKSFLVIFLPDAAGAASATFTMDGAVLSVTGTGVVVPPPTSTEAYEVDLNWDPPASSAVAVAGYNVYRSTGSGAYELLNKEINTPTSFADTTVANGTSYNYQVTSVDAAGVESAPSNVYTAAIP